VIRVDVITPAKAGSVSTVSVKARRSEINRRPGEGGTANVDKAFFMMTVAGLRAAGLSWLQATFI
jgi:hypothetical protein